MRRALVSLSLAAVLSFALSSAQAATVTYVNEASTGWTNVFGGTHTDDGSSLDVGPHGSWAVTPTSLAGSIPTSRSPYDGSGPGGSPINATWQTIPYYVVGPAHLPTSATLNFSKDQDAFSFLWGSVDTYNELQFWLDGALLFSVLSTDLPGVITGTGAAFVSVTDVIFDQIRFFSAQSNALEFANITTSPVPLPPALVLFGSALAGLGYLMRRRRETGPQPA